MSVKFEITGLKDVQRNFNRYLNEINGVLDSDLDAVAFDLLQKAVDRAPIEDGDLRESGQVVRQKKVRIVSFSVFKNGFDYAIKQHEDLTLRHSGPEHGNVDGGEAKYLERPFQENAEKYIARIKANVLRRTAKYQ